LLQAGEILDAMDTDKDGKVSATEWVEGVSTLTKDLSQEDFKHLLCALLYSSKQTMDYCGLKDYEPINNVQYLKSTLGRHLERGLATVCSKIAAEHATIASKKLWDSDGCLPESYQPPNPVRLLAEWLQQNNAYTEFPHDDPRELDWSSHIPWESLNLDRQLKILFYHLDCNNSGCVPG
jgi:hypothetical protein